MTDSMPWHDPKTGLWVYIHEYPSAPGYALIDLVVLMGLLKKAGFEEGLPHEDDDC